MKLTFSVQYGTPAAELPRWRLRRWALAALRAGADNLAEPPAAAALTLRIVDADEGRELNLGYRGRDYATNVLTFEYGVDPEGTLYGDIVLCLPVLEREAAEQGKTLRQHAAHLVVHGVLHALGHDHLDEAEAAEMEALETAILARLGVDDPYRETLIE